MDQFVWVGEEGPSWLTGGTYLVVRRIRIAIERWDSESLVAQEEVIGRHKVSGAPLGMYHEHDALDLDALNAAGSLAIPAHAHVRVASPEQNWGQMLLRRSYSYTGGTVVTAKSPRSSQDAPVFDAGILFCAYQRNPRLAFIPIFRKMAVVDSLSAFTTHTASAIAALPRGAAHRGEWVGQQLFE